MKKLHTLFLLLLISNIIAAQGRIDLKNTHRSIDIQESSFETLKSTFSFNAIESKLVETEVGTFSAITIDKTISGGNYGAPSLPIARELVAVPFGAEAEVKVLNYSVTDYNLADYGIERIYPQQESMSKSAKPEDIVFHYDESAYQTRSLTDAPKTSIEILGTMRGIRLGALQVEPVSYNPTNNTLRVFNDIEVEITFKNADIALTEQTLLRTYSPYFDVIYRQLFNSRAISDFYDEHPDLIKYPVKMLVVADRMFEEAMQPWIKWKTQKGFYLDVKYTDEIGNTSADIKDYVKQKYETDAPSFLILFGDQAQLPPSKSSGYDTQKVTDAYYASIDDDYMPEMYCSRMCCETVEEMNSLIEKTLQYEQYTMPDPSYLANALLIAGYDSWYNQVVGQPTVQYVSHYYINEDNGYDNVHKYLNSYSGCYSNLSTGVGFALYTAHGMETLWDDPRFSVSDVDYLTNTDKYFWAVGNCCLSGNWGYSFSKSLGEAMICADKKGAWGYIGSCPVTYWWEDYYFAVGATNVTNTMPEYEETSTGCYDALWSDSFNTLAAVTYSGNLAVAYSHLNNYTSATSSRYYYEAYHTLGDGSVMPYRANPTANEVSHLYTIPSGIDSFTIEAAPGSYVGISSDGVLHGAGMVDDDGIGNITVNDIIGGQEYTIVVSHPDHYPYIETITSTVIEGVYLVFSSCRINDENKQIDSGESISMSLDIINAGSDDASNIELTLTTDSEFVTMIDNTASISSLTSGDKVTIDDEFSFVIADDVPDKTVINFKLVAATETESWENNFSVEANAPALTISNVSISNNNDIINPGETVVMKFEVRNEGGSTAHDVLAELSCRSNDIKIIQNSFSKEALLPGDVMSVSLNIFVPSTVSDGSMYQINIDASSAKYKANDIYDFYVGTGIESFESGDFSSFDWIMDGTNDWVITTEDPYDGTYCAKSCDITNSVTSSTLKLRIEVYLDDSISFYRRTVSPTFDVYSFYVDGELMDQVSGTEYWKMYEQPISKGTHELEWRFERNRESASTLAFNNAYIDYLKLPPQTVVLYDDVDVAEMEEVKRDIILYPNPTTGMLNINIDGIFNAVVYDYQGKVMRKINDAQGQIDLSGLTSGMYFIEIRNNNKNIIEKIILK